MLIIPIASHLYQSLTSMAQNRRIVLMAGLPGVGKSLMIQQLALLAHEAGREVHLMQWDEARKAFETAENLTKYPEINGVTHPVIRKAVGTWSRKAVVDWHIAHASPNAMLIAEVPLIGNRFLELAQVHDDPAEPLLKSEATLFVIPIPSLDVRATIEKRREETIANPRHETEKKDAPPHVLRDLWYEVNVIGREINLTQAPRNAPYDPAVYSGVYQAILHQRHVETLMVDQVLQPKGSVYELGIVAGNLQADAETAKAILAEIEADYTVEKLAAEMAQWHKTVMPSKFSQLLEAEL